MTETGPPATEPEFVRLYPQPTGQVGVDDVDDAYAGPRVDDDRPWVVLNMIASVDGGTSIEEVSGGLGGPADRAVFSAIRARADVILVGSSTVVAEQYGPPSADSTTRERRTALGAWPEPRLAIVSGRLGFDWQEAVFGDRDSRPFIVTTESADPKRLEAAREHADVIMAGKRRVDFATALRELQERGARAVLSEGGPTVNGQLAADGLLDELCLSMAPMLVGGEGSRILAGPSPESPIDLELAHVLTAGGYLFLRYLRR